MTILTGPDSGRLTTLDQITDHLKRSPQPFFYVSRSATNLVGMDRWVGGFRYVTLNDSWDGGHPNAFSPSNVPSIEPRGNIEIANWLLRNDQVQRYISEQTPSGYTPKVVITMFDEQTEQICRELGYELIMPSIELRNRLDSKIVTTQLGNEAGAASVPNILTSITGWEDLSTQAEQADLGTNLVIQLPYGDSGRTTYFVASREDFDRIATEITGPEIKVMRQINHLSLAAEAVVTKAGTVVGPVLREITGHPELTAYRGGWAGSEHYPGLLDPEARRRTLDLVERFADRLAVEGYRGILEVSVLLDTDTGDAYLGELNPRISGSSAHSNLTPGDTTLPLFAYHVLEFSDCDFDLDLSEIKHQRDDAFEGQTWSTLVIQYQGDHVSQVTAAPRSGRYRRTEGGASLEYIGPDLGWHALSSPDEVYWLRTVGVGAFCGTGLDVGMVITRTQAQEAHYALTEPTKQLIRAVLGQYRGRRTPLPVVYWRAGLRRLRALMSR